MQVIRSITAYYPAFHVGSKPAAVECQLSIVEANGRRYLKTPFAFVDAHADDDCERQLGRGYYATEAEALEYLAHEYPHWERAAPIMDAIMTASHHYGNLVGAGRVADKIGQSVDALYLLARGQRRFTLKAVKDAVKALAN